MGIVICGAKTAGKVPELESRRKAPTLLRSYVSTIDSRSASVAAAFMSLFRCRTCVFVSPVLLFWLGIGPPRRVLCGSGGDASVALDGPGVPPLAPGPAPGVPPLAPGPAPGSGRSAVMVGGCPPLAPGPGGGAPASARAISSSPPAARAPCPNAAATSSRHNTRRMTRGRAGDLAMLPPPLAPTTRVCTLRVAPLHLLCVLPRPNLC